MYHASSGDRAEQFPQVTIAGVHNMKASEFLVGPFVGDGKLAHDSPEIWVWSDVDLIMRSIEESDRARTYICLHSLVFETCEELLNRGQDLDLRFVGCATVQHIRSHTSPLTRSYICMMSHCGYDFRELIADIAVQLSAD